MFKLDEVFKINNIDTIIHLAARAGVRESKDFPEEHITTNIIGTQNLIMCAEKYNISKFIFFSSSSVLGEQQPPNSEEDSIKPASIYGVTKATGEMLLKMSSIECRVVVRPFTIYGKYGRVDQVFYKWISQIKAGRPISFYGDGSSKRGYIHVSDLIKGVEILLNRDEKGFEIFNLGGNEIIALSMILDIFKKEVPELKLNQLPRLNDDPYENYADCTKAKNILNWLPKACFETEVIKMLKKELPKNNL